MATASGASQWTDEEINPRSLAYTEGQALENARGPSEGTTSSSNEEDASSSSPLTATIVSTSNQFEEEPWMPVKSIITMFRIQVRHGDEQWDVMRRYNDFNQLHLQMTRAFDASLVPPLPPKLLFNSDESIAERHLELDAYLRTMLAHPALSTHGRLLEFLGVEKHGVRYGVRRYEYDSAHSEGNRYIRDNDL